LRIAMACSNMVDERRRHGKRRIRLDLLNGMHIAVLTLEVNFEVQHR